MAAVRRQANEARALAPVGNERARPTTRPKAAPRLHVVSNGQRAMRFGVLVGIAVFGVMFAVTAFQTRIAANEQELDKVREHIADARDHYDVLRMQRAELRSPERLTAEAGNLGMQPARPVEFASTDPSAVAAMLVATADLHTEQAQAAPGPLEAYGVVKSGGALADEEVEP
jgi:cell division protein FtsL